MASTQRAGGPLLSLGGSWGLSWGHRAWWQVPLPAEPPHLSLMGFKLTLTNFQFFSRLRRIQSSFQVNEIMLIRKTNLCINLLKLKHEVWKDFFYHVEAVKPVHIFKTMETQKDRSQRETREGDRAHPSSQSKKGYAVVRKENCQLCGTGEVGAWAVWQKLVS